MGLQARAFETGFSELEAGTPFAFGNNPAEALFHEGPQGRPLSMSQLTGIFKKTIWYLYGCLHIALYINKYT